MTDKKRGLSPIVFCFCSGVILIMNEIVLMVNLIFQARL